MSNEEFDNWQTRVPLVLVDDSRSHRLHAMPLITPKMSTSSLSPCSCPSLNLIGSTQEKPRSDNDDLLHYCQLFTSISRGLVLRKRLDLYTQYQWFLQSLPERVLRKFSIDMAKILRTTTASILRIYWKKALVLIRCRKRFADFIKEDESNYL